MPEPRLWAPGGCPLPTTALLLERDQGSLIRHVALVVPHSFSRSEGLRFDPEALELWVTHRLMLLDDICGKSWAGRCGATSPRWPQPGVQTSMGFGAAELTR